MRDKKWCATLWISGGVTFACGLIGSYAEQPAVAFSNLATQAWSAIIPAEKNLSPAWEKGLYERGAPTAYTGDALMNIGMPVNGICSGLVYLGGDGKLWVWDIFNRNLNGVQPRQIQYKGRSWHGHPPGLGAWQGGNYVEPVTNQPAPFEQGFALKVTAGGKEQFRTLDRQGWKNVVFSGAYPFGTVSYSDPECPVKVTLEGYSPFVPLNFDDSSYPALIMNYRVENTGKQPATVEVGGWLENPVLIDSAAHLPGLRRINTIFSQPGLEMVSCAAIPPFQQTREAILFDDFESGRYQNWSVEGTAFGSQPAASQEVPGYMGALGMQGKYVVNSHITAPVDLAVQKNDTEKTGIRDAAVGKLISRAFKIERNFITFLIGGGSKCTINLVVDNKVVQRVAGHNNNAMREANFAVEAFAGQSAHLEIIDGESGGWGNIGIDRIVFTDQASEQAVEQLPDWGTMALAAIGANPSQSFAQLANTPQQVLLSATSSTREVSSPADRPLIGGVTQTLILAPGAAGSAEFVIAWHFANTIEKVRGADTGHYYGKRFKDAAAVVTHIAAEAKRLDGLTRLWNQTWYDSTLPYWFLERTFISLDCLASTTCYRFADGRFYTYEGIRSCAGHPNHVWHYAQGHARIFPELEQDVLERVWYGFGFHEDGSVAYRGEVSGASAIDGHCGVILSVLRAHQTNPDSQMLKRLWPRVKKSIEYAISCDRDGNGLLDTPMLTTLDEPWHGEIPWISSLYIAALRAGAEMATEMGDLEFAKECQSRAAKGRTSMDAKLFNGEWFIQIPDPANPTKLGAYETCHIDQVLGQAWAWQVGLGRVLNEETTRSALRALWKYNFARNLDAFDQQADPKGRPYYTDGEGGLVMTANALGRKVPFGVYSGFACYLNETMNGFEYQAAAHMIAEGMVKEGLSVIRTLNERYDGNKRNPFNEVECGDHYARSMASYGALIAISGFECNGPQGYIGFDPKLSPENFKAPFTAAEGWGSYQQVMTGKTRLQSSIALKYGTLRLRNISLGVVKGMNPRSSSVSVAGTKVPCSMEVKDGKLLLALSKEIIIKAGESLDVVVE